MDGAAERANREWPHLLQLYERGASTADLAAQTGLGKTTVRKYLLALGAQFRDPGRGRRLAFMRKCPVSREQLWNLRVREHRTLDELAALFDSTRATVGRWLTDYDIPCRSRREAMLQYYETHEPRPATPEQRAAYARASRQRAESDPQFLRDIAAKGNEIRSRLYAWRYRMRARPCAWCGAPVFRKPQALRRSKRSVCNPKCRSRLATWMQHHSGEARPLIVALLNERAGNLSEAKVRNAASEIGAEETEIIECLAHRLQPVIPTALTVQDTEPPQQPRKKALKSEEIGPLGEALLRVARKE